MPPVRIFVFGSSGQGKSSLINLLSGKETPPCAVGNGVIGTTFSRQTVRFAHEGIDYEFIDTVGLNESDAGQRPTKEALRSLKQLLQAASKDGGGYNLAIMVHKDSRLSSVTFSANYKLVVEAMLGDTDIPVMLVKTGVESSGPLNLDEWLYEPNTFKMTDTSGEEISYTKTNEEFIREQFPRFTRVVPACTVQITTDRGAAMYGAYRTESYKAVWEAIESIRQATPITLPAWLNVFDKMWNSWVAWMRWIVPPRFKDAVSSLFKMPELLKWTLRQLGFTDDDIVDFVNT